MEGEKAELSEQNMQALTAYYEHEQGDRLTRRVFGLIRRVMDSHDRSLQHNIMELLTVSRL